MTISIQLIDPLPVINSRINKAIAQELNLRISQKVGRVRNQFRSIILGWVMEQPEIQSLISQGVPGSLNAEFGLPPGSPFDAIHAIASSVASATEVTFKKVSNKLTGGIVFNFQSTSFSNLLGLPQGHVIADFGGSLHWLDWLLTKGDTIIITGYFYKPGRKGRSGGGTMKEGGFFRVNPRFSGTVENNFITRAFLGREKQLSILLSSFLR
jgi:hypothetical protein